MRRLNVVKISEPIDIHNLGISYLKLECDSSKNSPLMNKMIPKIKA